MWLRLSAIVYLCMWLLICLAWFKKKTHFTSQNSSGPYTFLEYRNFSRSLIFWTLIHAWLFLRYIDLVFAYRFCTVDWAFYLYMYSIICKQLIQYVSATFIYLFCPECRHNVNTDCPALIIHVTCRLAASNVLSKSSIIYPTLFKIQVGYLRIFQIVIWYIHTNMTSPAPVYRRILLQKFLRRKCITSTSQLSR